MKTHEKQHMLWNKQWLVVYTRPRWEKKIERLLQIQGIDAYCPLRKVISQWADRKKQVMLPLFNSYVFVRINDREYHKVQQTLGVINFVYHMAKPAVIKDEWIEKIKEHTQNCSDLEVLNLAAINAGDRVMVRKGLFLDQLNCILVTKIPLQGLKNHLYTLQS